MRQAMRTSEPSAMLLLQFFVDLFEEEGVLPQFLKEAVDCQSNLRDFTYVGDSAVKQILSVSRDIYRAMPTRAVNDGFDLHKNYCNAQFAWVFTARNVLDLVERFKRFDPKGMIRLVHKSRDTVKIELGRCVDIGVYEHIFCLSAMLGMLRACVPAVDIEICHTSKLPELNKYISDRGECDIKPGHSIPVVVIHAPDLLEMPLITRNDALSVILEPSRDFATVPLCESDFVSEALSLIKKSLHKQGFSLNHLAADMGTSRRTLQRRLKEQELTFNKLLRTERRRKAIELIDENQHDRSRIVEMVGYSELSSLYRLVRRD